MVVGRTHGHDGDVAAPLQQPVTTLHGAAASSNVATTEDATVVGPAWFALSDGLGGHPGGELASAECVATVGAAPPPTDIDDVADLFDAANRAVRSRARADATPGMGATLVLVATVADRTVVAHVGDSRCYRLRHGELSLLTHDHSHVHELVELGCLPPDEAASHPLRHVVTRAVGLDPVVRPDVVTIEPGVGRLLLCSDGVSDVLTPRTIGRVLAGVRDAAAAAARLVALAEREGHDDASAIVIDELDATRG